VGTSDTQSVPKLSWKTAKCAEENCKDLTPPPDTVAGHFGGGPNESHQVSDDGYISETQVRLQKSEIANGEIKLSNKTLL